MGEHNISGGWVGNIEKNSIRDGKRCIGGTDICRIVDLKFIGGNRNCGMRVSRLASRIWAKLPHLDIQCIRAIRHK